MANSQLDELRTRLESFDSEELIDRLRKKYFTEEAADLAKEILRTRHVNIDLSMNLQEKRIAETMQKDDASATLLYGRWLVALQISGALAGASLFGQSKQASMYIFGLLLGGFLSSKLGREYIDGQNASPGTKLRNLRLCTVVLFVISVALHSTLQ